MTVTFCIHVSLPPTWKYKHYWIAVFKHFISELKTVSCPLFSDIKSAFSTIHITRILSFPVYVELRFYLGSESNYRVPYNSVNMFLILYIGISKSWKEEKHFTKVHNLWGTTKNFANDIKTWTVLNMNKLSKYPDSYFQTANLFSIKFHLN